jgi:acetolactate synthase-1/2/3 large subunit
MILAGGGVTICNSFKALQNLAEFLMAPVVTTFKGKGAFPENHPLALGPIGMHGHIEANKMILEADVLLAIGCRFSDRSVGRWDTFGNNMKIIHIDVDKSELGKNKRPTVGIHGDLNITLNKLLPILMKKSIVKNNPWMARLKSLKNQYKDTSSYDDDTVNPRSVLKELRKAIPNNTIITTDVGQHQMWSSLYFDIYSPGTFFTSTGLGTMGFGFPAALGAKVGKPNLPSICISGDGSFNMVEQALATAVLDNIPAIVVILNNGSLGMVAQWQRVFYNKRYLGVNLQNSPDFVKIAQAYGAEGIRVQSLPEFNKAVKNALKSEVATVIDVPIDPEADVFPFVAPGTSLADMILPS